MTIILICDIILLGERSYNKMTYTDFINNIVSERGCHDSYSHKVDGMEIHHIKPVSLGGDNHSNNLVLLTYAGHLMAHVLMFRENRHNCKIAKALKILSYTKSIEELLNLVDNKELFEEYVSDIVEARSKARNAQCGAGNHMYNKIYGDNPNAKSRVCVDTGEVFSSAKEAAESIGVSSCCVIDACNGKQHEAGGLKWMNYNDWQQLTDEERCHIRQARLEEVRIKNIPKEITPKPIFWTEERRREWGKRFSGENSPMHGKHHSEETKKKLSDIFSKKNIGEGNPMYGKHHSDETKKKISNKTKISVICIENKKVFNSLNEASQWCGLKKGAGSICSCCKGKQKTAGGYRWQYYEEYLTNKEIDNQQGSPE